MRAALRNPWIRSAAVICVEHLTERMEEEIRHVMDDIDAYGGVVKAIEDGWLQARLAEERRTQDEDRLQADRLVGRERISARQRRRNALASCSARSGGGAACAREIRARSGTSRQSGGRRRAGELSAEAANKDHENLMPYLVDCCHAYATVGEIVTRLKRWANSRSLSDYERRIARPISREREF